jgi:hypothetical protein
MTALLLHIGSAKAGSSAIQASLAQAASELHDRHGLLVLPPNPYRRPLPSGFLAACHLSQQVLPRYLDVRQREDPQQFQRDLEAYRQLVADLVRLGKPARVSPWQARLQRMAAERLHRSAHAALASSEYLMRLPIPEIHRLRQWFEALGIRRFRVVAYVREPVSAYASFLQQWLRLSDVLEPYDPAIWMYRFRKHLQAWAAVFSPDELIVRSFSRDFLEGGSVVRDFYGQCSQFFGCLISGPEPDAVNESLSIEALTLVQELLAAVPSERRLQASWTSGMSKFLRLLRQEAAALPCAPVQLQPWVSRLVWERHQGDLDWLHQTHGIQFDAPALQEGSGERPAEGISLSLQHLLVPLRDSQLVQQLKQRQLEAVVREGLR